MVVNGRQHEPTLEDMLSDSIIKAVMKADGVDPHQLSGARPWQSSCSSALARLCPRFGPPPVSHA
jgi:hypothetical protein